MLETPMIVKSPEVLTAHLHFEVPRSEIQGLGSAWGELMAWIAANGLKARADLWECYLAGPDLNPDPATFRTELNRPLEI